MALHPIKALDQVIDEYRDYLRTEFRAKDAALRAALERELDAPSFLAQEPFYQAHRPFRQGKRWRDLQIDPKLAHVMEGRSQTNASHLHQSQAIEELLKPDAHPVVVTTGTGSGKTEAFLLPVIQNAFEDSVRFNKSGLTAILVYPMNALANDQRERIKQYLDESGFAGAIRVEQYDRGTSQAKRQEMRANPPHILLTNYMMLEYLLVRPADREDIFANHRCRFLVLDEVHTYRGVLGSNIALLVRRLRVHLAQARQDWRTDVSDQDRIKRYPNLVPIGTSATIKSVSEENTSGDRLKQLRDEAVQEFFSNLTGADCANIKVIGEELQEIEVPSEASYPPQPGTIDLHNLNISDPELIRQALCNLAALPASTSTVEAVRRYRLLWDLNRWLIRRPMSVSQIVEALQAEVPGRSSKSPTELRAEVESALTIGAALPDGVPGVLRLRAHRFIRGGWKFHRCVNPQCGKLYPRGEERCTECNHVTAPLYLCRNCGADYLRFIGDPDNAPLRPSADHSAAPEWMLYDPARFELQAIDDDEDEPEEGAPIPQRARRGNQQAPTQIRNRPVIDGSLDPDTLSFSRNPGDYPIRITLAPARSRCLCCGGTAGSRNVITPLALGTSAAVKVLSEGVVETLAEANRDRPGHDGKERLLVFSDSRQDAAHQARFIIFASRYDRMRRRLFQILQRESTISIQRAVELLSDSAVTNHDNPYVPTESEWIPDERRNRIQVWEEAPLLDELSINAGYRATLVNLGLVAVAYHRLDEFVRTTGEEMARRLNVNTDSLIYICRVLLDEMRTRGALSRPLLCYHPSYIAYPAHFRDAEWERRVKVPQGYSLTKDGQIATNIDSTDIPNGIRRHNAWRRHGVGGRSPSLERILRHLLDRYGGTQPAEDDMQALLEFLRRGQFLVPSELCGARDRRSLLQVNDEVIRLQLVQEVQRLHCEVCGDVKAGARIGDPCPFCHGALTHWPDSEINQNRSVRRIQTPKAIPLVAGEHTAQITSDVRTQLETDFKAVPQISPMNVLACSPTLEMGIDVGGLDAIILRNVPPRPDNYAQRGGRAGRRTRVGMVLGYARSTPHDQYFFDKPQEMIAGEVPAPMFSLGNFDVFVRHLYAIVFGAAEPGLSGRMSEYVSPEGQIKEETVAALIEGVRAQTEHGLSIARTAFGADILASAGLTEELLREKLNHLPERIRHVVESTARQVINLRQALDYFAQNLEGQYAGVRAGVIVARLLGIQTDATRNRHEADDRSAGYPLRRFAEFGLLPGYEFPSEPSSLRLLGDDHEEDPISTTRRFGIAQFQPGAHVYARRRRWRVIGLDPASPWNPRSDVPTWSFRICNSCGLRYNAAVPSCPRCQRLSPGQPLPAFDFAGFLAKKEEFPILDEEERYPGRNLIQTHPQWNGDVVGRWTLTNGWALRLSRNEEVRWVNEGIAPSATDLQNHVPTLHREAKGYLVCPSCGHMLEPPPPPQIQRGGRRNAVNQQAAQNNAGHSATCPLRGGNPRAVAITTSGTGEVLRVLVPVPLDSNRDRLLSWGISTGYALLYGMQLHYMLDASELDFQLEGPWEVKSGDSRVAQLSLAFVDVSLGGSGYLARIAENFHLVAQRTIQHLDHTDCETACYRCLKGYRNQRFHEHLAWPQTISVLEELAQSPPQSRPLQTCDIDDPRPWLEAFAAGVGSPLELKFLRLFEKHGFHPQKQVPVSTSDGTPPISVADFAVPERRLAIYIDGASFHVGQNLRRDRFIRKRLREGTPPWRVVELSAHDLQRGESLVSDISN